MPLRATTGETSDFDSNDDGPLAPAPDDTSDLDPNDADDEPLAPAPDETSDLDPNDAEEPLAPASAPDDTTDLDPNDADDEPLAEDFAVEAVVLFADAEVRDERSMISWMSSSLRARLDGLPPSTVTI